MTLVAMERMNSKGDINIIGNDKGDILLLDIDSIQNGKGNFYDTDLLYFAGQFEIINFKEIK